MNNDLIKEFIATNEINSKYQSTIEKLFYIAIKLGAQIYKTKDKAIGHLLGISLYAVRKFLYLVLKYLERIYTKKLDYFETDNDEIIMKWIN
ncbi:hypothetical protein [Mycoplasma sp. 125]|uniref:hypothetical protein n=1 Tax=Mycoplasma sp. 125 TaxID=3447505 RepID=UPI003F65803D